MNISEELVRELQKKVDVSYEEAEYYLKRTRGDVNMAYDLIMRKKNSTWESVKTGMHQALINLFKYRFVLKRKDEIFINLPLALILFLILVFDGLSENFFFLILICVIALATECEVKIKKFDKDEQMSHQEQDLEYEKETVKKRGYAEPKEYKEYKVNELDSKQPPASTDVQVELNENIKENVDSNAGIADKKEDDYYEIVIEE